MEHDDAPLAVAVIYFFSLSLFFFYNHIETYVIKRRLVTGRIGDTMY